MLCCSCPTHTYANDVCLILLIPPLEQYWFFGAIASLPVVLSMSAFIKTDIFSWLFVFKNTEIYHGNGKQLPCWKW